MIGPDFPERSSQGTPLASRPPRYLLVGVVAHELGAPDDDVTILEELGEHVEALVLEEAPQLVVLAISQV